MASGGMRSVVRLAALACAAGLTGRAAGAAGVKLYDNTGNPANTYYAEQGGAEALDDLHLISSGALDTLVFEYFDPAIGGTFSATANLYANPNGLDLGATLLAGPFVVNALPRGRRAVSIPLAHLQTAGASLWVGVQFSSATAGLILKDAPATGSSHDLYLENGGFYWFGGSPKANFGLRLVGTQTPLAVGDDAELGRVTLAPPEPNPFRAGSTLGYAIARRGPVRLDVLDLSGRRTCSLVNRTLEAGSYTARWSGRNEAGHLVAAGVYFVRLQSAGTVATRRVVFAP